MKNAAAAATVSLVLVGCSGCDSTTPSTPSGTTAVPIAAVNPAPTTEAAANPILLSDHGMAVSNVDGAGNTFILTRCGWTGDGPQIDGVATDGTTVVFASRGRRINLRGPAGNFEGALLTWEFTKTGFKLSGDEVAGHRKWALATDCS